MRSTTASFSRHERGSATTALVSVIGALIIVCAVAAAFYYFDTPPPSTLGRVLSVDVFPVHNTSGGNGVIAGGISGQEETFNEIIVLANVELKNNTKSPIHLFDLDSFLYIPGADIYENGGAGQKDFGRVFIAYPEMKAKENTPLLRGSTLAPGQTITGQLVFHYPLTLAQWKSRSQMHIVIDWQHQTDLVLKLKGNATSTGWQHYGSQQ